MLRRVALLANPHAGGGRARGAAAAAVGRLREHGISVAQLAARTAGDVAAAGRAAVADGVDALVVVGGDGTVSRVLPALACTAAPLGLVPAGTGNDLAGALGLPPDPVRAADVIAAALLDRHTGGADHAGTAGGGVRPLDLARVSGAGSDRPRWYAGVLAAGFDALVNARADRMPPALGRRRYELAMLAELPGFRPLRYRLRLDGEPVETEAMLVAVGNAPAYGGGLQVCAGARLDDGFLDVLLVTTMRRAALLRVFPRVYAGTHLSHPAVSVRRVRRVEVDAPGVVGYADGEPVGPLPLAVEAVPAALRVLVPTG